MHGVCWSIVFTWTTTLPMDGFTQWTHQRTCKKGGCSLSDECRQKNKVQLQGGNNIFFPSALWCDHQDPMLKKKELSLLTCTNLDQLMSLVPTMLSLFAGRLLTDHTSQGSEFYAVAEGFQAFPALTFVPHLRNDICQANIYSNFCRPCTIPKPPSPGFLSGSLILNQQKCLTLTAQSCQSCW